MIAFETMRRLMKLFVSAGVLAAFSASCTTDPYTGEQQMSRTAIGSVLGSLAGAGIGAASGDDSKERRERALIGAGIGALGGGVVGNYMDRQEARLRAELQGTGVQVRRTGNQLILNMPGNITFASDSADIQSGFFPVLTSVGKVLNEFPKTLIDVAGHTDNTGSRQYNYNLSQRRAESVADFLRSQRVNPDRMYVQGFGPDHPITDNRTPEGRQQNRRVELSLQPFTQ